MSFSSDSEVENMSESSANQGKNKMPVVLKVVLSLFVGFLVGVFFHYLLYRLQVPGTPFIYVAF